MHHAVSKAVFRDALSRFASGVTIVTAFGPDAPVGFTATAFSSASLVPPLVLICVDKTASAYEGVFGAPEFGVSILEKSQGPVALRFATHGIDRFEGTVWRQGTEARVPLIEGALVSLECRRHREIDAGDHTILLGEVLGATVGEGEPLLHVSRRFGRFADL